MSKDAKGVSKTTISQVQTVRAALMRARGALARMGKGVCLANIIIS